MKFRQLPLVSMKPDYPRRRLLKYSAYTFLLGISGLLPDLFRPVKHVQGIHNSGLGMPLESMQAFGREYLQKFPQENSHSILLKLLQDGTGLQEDGPYGLSPDGLRASIKNDFSKENVVYLKNWGLARSEARLFALSVV